MRPFFSGLKTAMHNLGKKTLCVQHMPINARLCMLGQRQEKEDSED